MSMDDSDGQMIVWDLGGLKLPDISLTGEEKTPKKPHPRSLYRPGIEPGPAAWQARMLPLVPQRDFLILCPVLCKLLLKVTKLQLLYAKICLIYVKNILTKIIISPEILNVKLFYISWNFYREFCNVLLQNLMRMEHFEIRILGSFLAKPAGHSAWPQILMKLSEIMLPKDLN